MQNECKFNVIYQLKKRLGQWPLGRIIYACIPFVLVGAMYFFIYKDNVLLPVECKEGQIQYFSFWDDRSNSIAIPYLMIISYFLAGSYVDFSIATYKKFSEYHYSIGCNSNIWNGNILKIALMFCHLGWIAGQGFVIIAKQNDKFWSNYINGFPTEFIYSICLGLTWYSALTVGVTEIYICYQYSKALLKNPLDLSVNILKEKGVAELLRDSIIVLLLIQ